MGTRRRWVETAHRDRPATQATGKSSAPEDANDFPTGKGCQGSPIYQRSLLLRALRSLRTTWSKESGEQDVVSLVPDPKRTGPSLSDERTTVMLKNIPFHYTRDMVCAELEKRGLGDAYDYLYLPMERSSGHNFGYMFINFRSPEKCSDFAAAFHGVPVKDCFPGGKTGKLCEVRTARAQGLHANLERLRAQGWGSRLSDREEWQPLFLGCDGRRVPLEELPESAPPEPRPRAEPRELRLGAEAEPKPCPLPPTPDLWACATSQTTPLHPVFQAAVSGRTVAKDLVASRHRVALAAAKAAASAAACGKRLPVAVGSGEEKEATVHRQIEFYFSVGNICHDQYMRSLMDEEGWVDLEDLAKFPRLRSLGVDVPLAAAALRGSLSVELSPDGKRVRMASPTLRQAFPGTARRPKKAPAPRQQDAALIDDDHEVAKDDSTASTVDCAHEVADDLVHEEEGHVGG